MISPALIDWDASPLVPAVVQDASNLTVLMVGFMNRDALDKTVDSGLVTFFSRSRDQLWTKGETSGNVLHVVELRINCEENSLLVLANPVGPTCHTGHQSCYFRRVESDGSLTTILERVNDPTEIYADTQTALIRRWYGAYEFLRDNDLGAVSGTARRLNDPSFAFSARISDELGELAGVLDGSHLHEGLEPDAILEGSQVAYWLTSLAIRERVSVDQLHPEQALQSSMQFASGIDASAALRNEADTWRTFSGSPEQLVERYGHTLGLVAAACRVAGVDPITLVRADLEDLQSRDYLADYFSNT